MGLLVVAEALHSEPSKNWYNFTEPVLRSSVRTWTKDYKKPVLIHHNGLGECVGRVVEAKFGKSLIKPGLYTHIVTLDIIAPDAQAKVQDGRYKTVSMGCTTKAIKCSICGIDIMQEGWCGHTRGRKYKGKICMWNIEGPEYDEISFVNRPADPIAQIIDILKHTDTSQSISERRDTMQQSEKEKDTTLESDVEILDKIAQEESSDTTDAPTTSVENQETEVEDPEAKEVEDSPNEEVETLKQQINEKDLLLSEKTAQLEEITNKATSLTEEVETLHAEKEALVLEKTEISKQLKAAKDSNRDLVRATKSILVDTLAKIKSAVDGGEEVDLKGQFTSLNMKGLVAQVGELAESVKIIAGQRPVVPVQNPGEAGPEREVDEKSAKSLTQKDFAEVLIELLHNPPR